jgi:hypothetical protein
VSQKLKITHAHQTQRGWILNSFLKSGKDDAVTFTSCSVFVNEIPDELQWCNRNDRESYVYAAVEIDWVSMGAPYEGKPQVNLNASSVRVDNSEKKRPQKTSSKPARKTKTEPTPEPETDDDIPF